MNLKTEMIGGGEHGFGGGHRRSKKRKSNSNKSKKNKHKRKYSIRKNKRSTKRKYRKHKSRKSKKLIGGLSPDEIDEEILTEMTKIMDPSTKWNQGMLNLRRGEIRGQILREISEGTTDGFKDLYIRTVNARRNTGKKHH